MVIHLKRTLFLGLGGTGAEAILHTKKRFLDAFGEIPPMIGFLVIDTDSGILNIKLARDKSDTVSLETHEYLIIGCSGAMTIYNSNPQNFTWYPEINSRSLASIRGTGAGQVRSNGRFLALYNLQNIHTAINSAITNICRPLQANTKYALFKGDNKIYVNNCFSLSGGTGSGIFIDVSNELHKIAQGIGTEMAITPYIVMPDVFTEMSSGVSMQSTKPNAFGALKDLDNLLHCNVGQPLSTHFGQRSILYERPFELAVLVNNTTQNGTRYTHVKDLAEMIGLAMFVDSGELSSAVSSPMDNVKSIKDVGSFRIGNKEAWASGIGLCEVVYDSKKMATVTRDLCIDQLIKLLTNSDESMLNDVNAFIDDKDVMIRENNNRDDIIDSLLSKAPSYIFSATNYQDALTEKEDFLERATGVFIQEEIHKNLRIKLNQVQTELRKYLKRIMNNHGGLANAMNFLLILKEQMDAFKKEMEEEMNELLDRQAPNFDALRNEMRPTIFSRRIDEKELFEGSVNNEVTRLREIERRQFAIRFFNEINQFVNSKSDKIERLKEKLGNISAKAMREAVQIQNSSRETVRNFVIDLHNEDIMRIQIEPDDVKFATFTSNHDCFEFLGFDEDLIEERMVDYCNQLNVVKSEYNRGVENKIRELSDPEMASLINRMSDKSSPLWTYNFRGMITQQHSLHNFLLIGVPDRTTTIFTEDKKKSFMADGINNVTISSTFVKDRIIIYRFEGLVPIFAVDNVPAYEEKYKESNINHHIDVHWQSGMRISNFSIFPERAQDNSIMYWALAFIFKLAKYDKNQKKYYIHSLEHGDPIEDYWKELGDYRDIAFEEFRKLRMYEDIEKQIEEKRNSIGSDAFNELLVDARSSGKYKNQYSQIDDDHEPLKDVRMEKVAQLLRKEIDFVLKDLHTV